MPSGLSSNEIKRIRSLAQKKFRDELGLFVVEGEKMVSEALASDFEVVAVYRREEIGEEAMGRISQLASPSPVLAVVRKRVVGPDLGIGPGGLYLGLDSIRDPGNLGTILRVADWFGIDGVIASPDCVDVFNPKVVQATMGAIFRVNFRYGDLVEAASVVRSAGGAVYGTFLDGEVIYGADLSAEPALVVMGNESEGVSEAVSGVCSRRLFIPPFGGRPVMESLNVAVATAITVSEFKRRNYHNSYGII